MICINLKTSILIFLVFFCSTFLTLVTFYFHVNCQWNVIIFLHIFQNLFFYYRPSVRPLNLSSFFWGSITFSSVNHFFSALTRWFSYKVCSLHSSFFYRWFFVLLFFSFYSAHLYFVLAFLSFNVPASFSFNITSNSSLNYL